MNSTWANLFTRFPHPTANPKTIVLCLPMSILRHLICSVLNLKSSGQRICTEKEKLINTFNWHSIMLTQSGQFIKERQTRVSQKAGILFRLFALTADWLVQAWSRTGTVKQLLMNANPIWLNGQKAADTPAEFHPLAEQENLCGKLTGQRTGPLLILQLKVRAKTTSPKVDPAILR